MNHPDLLLLPAMMFADYLLTVAGAVQQEGKHSDHFKIEHYELNPVWQKDIAQKRWFNLRHIGLTLGLTGCFYAVLESGLVSFNLCRGYLGCALVTLGMIIGEHLRNLLVFRFLNRHPQEVTGQVILSHRFVLYSSLFQTLMALVPVGLIAVLSPSPFVIGALIGLLLFLLINGIWIARAQRKH